MCQQYDSATGITFYFFRRLGTNRTVPIALLREIRGMKFDQK